ncbi:hypothetical protein HYH03_015556 [Edaphochlamys debaryana]|uniref:FAS1 domain-containing protein n=1 Tax=Edaphochlamys debaryana TaxID=47281 RepID=A0A835XJ92_9CHLO|nr:hypothetical protein HYH03_015556 [Edaphochlamys debaryana]|eukprot:KAG2485747.1 hypothetical protein HYH03_015556 [Edaphochlamys debaryana]
MGNRHRLLVAQGRPATPHAWALLITLALVSCSEHVLGASSVLELIRSRSDLSTLRQLVTTAARRLPDFGRTLNATDLPFTMFLPNNDAFADLGLPREQLSSLSGRSLLQLLSQHVIPGAAYDLGPESINANLTTELGRTGVPYGVVRVVAAEEAAEDGTQLAIESPDGSLASVLEANLTAGPARAHVVGSVLHSWYDSLDQALDRTPQAQPFLGMARAVGPWLERWLGDAEVIFAPSAEAIAAANEQYGIALGSASEAWPPGLPALEIAASIAAYHLAVDGGGFDLAGLRPGDDYSLMTMAQDGFYQLPLAIIRPEASAPDSGASANASAPSPLVAGVAGAARIDPPYTIPVGFPTRQQLVLIDQVLLPTYPDAWTYLVSPRWLGDPVPLFSRFASLLRGAPGEVRQLLQEPQQSFTLLAVTNKGFRAFNDTYGISIEDYLQLPAARAHVLKNHILRPAFRFSRMSSDNGTVFQTLVSTLRSVYAYHELIEYDNTYGFDADQSSGVMAEMGLFPPTGASDRSLLFGRSYIFALNGLLVPVRGLSTTPITAAPCRRLPAAGAPASPESAAATAQSAAVPPAVAAATKAARITALY